MARGHQREQQQQQQAGGGRRRAQAVSSTTSLGKRRRREQSAGSPRDPKSMRRSNDEYGSQSSPFVRVTSNPKELVKVTILGASGGIGQPLSLLLMLHSEYVQHLALHDLADSIHGVGLDVSHVDRQMKVTTHLGQEGLAEAVRGAKVIVIPAGLAQKPGMSRDDLFASNAEIMLNLAKTCATVAPDAQLAIITNPVNSLVPLVCEVYGRLCNNKAHGHPPPATATAPSPSASLSPSPPVQAGSTPASSPPPQPGASQPQPGASQPQHQSHPQPAAAAAQSHMAEPMASSHDHKQPDNKHNQAAHGHQSGGAGGASKEPTKSEGKRSLKSGSSHGGPGNHTLVFEDSFRRIFGVTTLDVVRASTLTAKSVFFKNELNGLHTDPSKIQVPVVGGHAGKTIMPLLSQATPKLDKDRLQRERTSTLTLIHSIQEAGIDVLNAKRGRGSATLAMAYAACRFTISLLRAQSGEQNIVECAYVRHATPVYGDLDYFSVPLLLGKDGYIKSMGLGKPLAFEQQMLEEGARELKLSIVRGEDFARERLYAESK